jgi:hypothetical protein
LVSAFQFNPLLMLCAAGLLLYPFTGPIPSRFAKAGWTVFGAALALNWWYLLLFLPR